MLSSFYLAKECNNIRIIYNVSSFIPGFRVACVPASRRVQYVLVMAFLHGGVDMAQSVVLLPTATPAM